MSRDKGGDGVQVISGEVETGPDDSAASLHQVSKPALQASPPSTFTVQLRLARVKLRRPFQTWVMMGIHYKLQVAKLREPRPIYRLCLTETVTSFSRSASPRSHSSATPLIALPFASNPVRSSSINSRCATHSLRAGAIPESSFDCRPSIVSCLKPWVELLQMNARILRGELPIYVSA